MWLEKSTERWTARLKPTGWGRYVVAVPLVAWLCGWFAGELFALSALGYTLWELLLPSPLADRMSGGLKMSAVGAVVTVLFLGMWLTFWTVGGAAALRALLALLVSEERLSFNPSGVTRWRRMGPWRSERHLERGELVDVDPEGPGGALVASLASGRTVELLRCGTVAQRRELAELLRELFALARDEPSLADRTPPGWDWERLPDGTWVLGPARHVRREQVLAWGYAAGFLGLGAALLAWRLFLDGGGWTGALFAWCLAALAALAGGRAWRGRHGRESWGVRRGLLTHVIHGVFRTRSTVYPSPELLVERNTDSEGDVTYGLFIISLGKQKSVGNRSSTPRAPLHLGHWLARRVGVPLKLNPPDLGLPEPSAAPLARRGQG